MKAEFDALVRNHTWDLIPAAPSMNVVDCKWLFRIKHKSNGSTKLGLLQRDLPSVSFSALRKDVVNVLDFIEILKNEEDQNVVDLYLTERLRLELAFICTYVQLSYSDLEQFEVVMTAQRQGIEQLLRSILYDGDSSTGFKSDMHHVLPRFMENIDDCINSCHHSTSSATMTEEQLNILLVNLHHLSKHQYLEEQMPSLATQYEILQNFRCMAERVGLFLWDELILENSSVFKLAHLFMNIFPIELEVMHICYTNLKASPSAEVGCFIKQLLETSPEVLRQYLIHLQEHMVTVITASTSGARNIHVMIEFLLIIVTDMPKDFIHQDKLFYLMARIGALIRETSTLIHDLEEKSRSGESTDETSRATQDLLKNIELLKEDVKYVSLKAPDLCQWSFPMSDGQLFMHLLHRHLTDLLDSDAFSCIKVEIELVREDLKFMRSFFVNVEKRLYKDLWARLFDAAYEAKDVIDSIIVRDNCLLHLIFSLPITIRKIKLIREEVSNLPEKIPKNKSLVVVNSPKNPVERKSLTTSKIIVGFKEETNWLIIVAVGSNGRIGSCLRGLGRGVVVGAGVEERAGVGGRPRFGRGGGPGGRVDSDGRLRVGSWNIGTLQGKSVELVKILRKRRINIACVQETKWVGSKARDVDGYKLWYSGSERRRNGVGILVDEELRVNQEYVEKKLLVKFFNQVTGSDLRFSVDIDVANKLRRQLFGKRYLIVLDDVWDTTKWDDLTRPFPDVEKGSRTILTTRQKEVAFHGKVNTDPLNLQLLSPEECWELLEKRAFGEQSCADELLDVGKEIAENCKGLPLVADLIAGVIAGREKTKSAWLEVRNNLNSFIFGSEVDVMKVIELSYDYLPHHMKPCFLYLASFPNDTAVDRVMLKMYWRAEGLVEQTGMKSLEEVMEIYLDNLISSSLSVVPVSLFMMVKDSLLNEICMLNHLRFLRIGSEVKFLPSSFSNLWNLETLLVDNELSTLVLLPRLWDLAKLRVLSIGACSFYDMDTNEPIVIAEDSKSENCEY
ncbi:hypothetical protein CQW23_13608 [Capsicum baccatum]|uniref:Uncharacterized protein n=1 Tax=Capsicum baccatum TaxID=33114 RepID=A0A2G2WH35_CAPBA|nr:hypothetical protein CQW23_13608 [Capsicum baccatum]